MAVEKKLSYRYPTSPDQARQGPSRTIVDTPPLSKLQPLEDQRKVPETVRTITSAMVVEDRRRII